MNDNKNNKPERRRASKPGMPINRICLTVIAVVFFAVAALNLFQFNRPTVSESEKRTLTPMPEFTFKGLFDGSYFEGVSDHISDTFLARESMIKFASSLDDYKGFKYRLNGVEYIYFGNQEITEPAEETTERQVITLPPPGTTESPETSDDPAGTTYPQDTTGTPVTGPDDTSSDPGDVTADPHVTTEPHETSQEPFRYVSIKLSQSSAEIPAESILTLNATLTTSGSGTPDPLKWTVSDESVLALSSDGTTASLLAKKQGNATVTVTVGGLSASCAIKVNAKSQEHTDPGQEITTGVFAYDGAIYQRINYSGSGMQKVTEEYSTYCQYLASYFPGTKVSYMPTPHATLMLDTAKVPKAGRDQGLILSEMASFMDPSINFVNVYPALKAHDNEYLYFKSDHHWTHLGAYYAYTVFAKSRGFTPTPLSEFKEVLVNDNYVGSYSGYLKTYNVSADKLIVYNPTKAHSMTVTYDPSAAAQVGVPTFTRSTCIVYPTWKSYMVFCGGDRPLATITVPANSKENGGEGKSIIVLKDSYGSAMSTYLCEHYEKIYVIDPRYFKQTFQKTLQDYFKGYKIDDILLTVNIQMANSYSWLDNFFWPMIGIKR